MNETEKIETIRRATVKAYEHLQTWDSYTEEDLKREVNENMLRYYIYGKMNRITPCSLCKDALAGHTSEKAFPVVFLTALIEHISKCEWCWKNYQDFHSSKESAKNG